MSIKQLSVFIENQAGTLDELVGLLGEGGIDLVALSIADTTDFGIVRAIVNDNEKALALVKEKGYTASLADVLAVAVPDTPGGLAGGLAALRAGDVHIEYLYSFVRRLHQSAIIIFRVDELEKAEALLRQGDFTLIEQAEISTSDFNQGVV